MEKDFQREYLGAIQETKSLKEHLKMLLPLFSVLIVAGVFWWLKLTGITLAGDAFCGMDEHVHDETCQNLLLVCMDESEEHEHTELCWEVLWVCELNEHIHDSSCYSDLSADIETPEIWEETLPDDYENLSIPDSVLAVAESQLDYTESERNFIVDAGLERHGYTRYGEWYGNPYGEWATMFTSFCLSYGGVTEVPLRAGADVMRLEWEEIGRWQDADVYNPLPGDVVFLDKNGNGTVETTAIVVENTGWTIRVIEGDLDGCVAETEYDAADSIIAGYGLTYPEHSLIYLGDISVGEESGSGEYIVYDTPEEIVEFDEYPELDTPEEIVEFDEYPELDTPEEIVEFDEYPELDTPVEEIIFDEYILTDGIVLEETAATLAAGNTVLATYTAYSSSMFTENSSFILYVQSGSNYYAIDGNSNAVQIYVDSAGNITSDVSDPDTLYWTFAKHTEPYEGQTKVVKLWKDTGYTENRPESITVDILKDGVFIESQELSESCSWSYRWTVPDDGAVWQVVEREVPEGYTVTVSDNGNTFLLTNITIYSEQISPQTGTGPVVWQYSLSMCVAGGVLLLLAVQRKERRK